MNEVRLDAAGLKLSDMIDQHDAHVGIGDCELVVYVTCSKSISKRFSATLPKEIDGFPVRVQYVGRIRPAALPA